MSIATVRIGKVMATQSRPGHFAQSKSGVIAPKQSTEGALPERHAHQEWMQRIENTWQGHLDSLQQCICGLFVASQRLRTSPCGINRPKWEQKDAGNF